VIIIINVLPHIAVNTTIYTYTPSYELQTTTYPDGSTISNTYDSADRLTAITDGRGNATTFAYDEAGRRTAVSNTLGNAIHYALDSNGNILATTNAIGHVTHYNVDALNRVTNTWDTVGSQTRSNAIEFDTAGRQTAVVNALAQRTQYAHDALGRVTTTTRPDQATERNALDALGNLLSYTNAKNIAIVRTAYDGQSRPTAQTNALGNGKSWSYDQAGNQLTRTDASGDTTEYTFDSLNQLTNIEYPDGKTAGFTHDQSGNLLTATNTEASLSFGYDTMHRITNVTPSVSSVQAVVKYTHDANGNRSAITYPGNKTVTHTYDEVNRLTGIDLTAFSLQPITFSHNEVGEITGITYPNGVTATYTRDTAGRLAGLKYAKSGTDFINRTYDYNPLGQITKRTITAGLEAAPADTHQYHKHNAADQLTHVSRMDNYEHPEQWRDVGPNYNPDGATTNITIGYNGMNLASTFIWDYDGQLTGYSGEHQTNLWFTAPPPPKNLSLKYDALGGRIARTGVTGGEKIHVLDQAAGLKNVLVQTDSSGTIERYYIYAPGFGLVAHIEANGTARYYHGDHLGSTIALTDANGNVTDEFAYTPYGELMAHTGQTETPYTFCGRHGAYWEGSALYHMKHRYYRADIARFISSDPIGISGGVNLYAYANGNPILFLDALGLCPDGGATVALGIEANGSIMLYHGQISLRLLSALAPGIRLIGDWALQVLWDMVLAWGCMVQLESLHRILQQIDRRNGALVNGHQRRDSLQVKA